MNRFSIILLTFSAIFAASGQLLFKIGAKNKNHIIEYINQSIFFGFIFYAFGAAVWIYVLSYEKLINTYPFTFLTLVMVYIGAFFLLGESLRLNALIGIVFILFGLYCISR